MRCVFEMRLTLVSVIVKSPVLHVFVERNTRLVSMTRGHLPCTDIILFYSLVNLVILRYVCFPYSPFILLHFSC